MQKKIVNTVGLEKTLWRAKKADNWYVLEVNIKHTDKSKKASLNFSILSGKKKATPMSEYTNYMKSTKLKQFYPTNKVMCSDLHWSAKFSSKLVVIFYLLQQIFFLSFWKI